MYKEPLASDEANRNMTKRIEQKMERVTVKVANTGQSDSDFTANLLDLCVLNLMFESHQANTEHHAPTGGR